MNCLFQKLTRRLCAALMINDGRYLMGSQLRHTDIIAHYASISVLKTIEQFRCFLTFEKKKTEPVVVISVYNNDNRLCVFFSCLSIKKYDKTRVFHVFNMLYCCVTIKNKTKQQKQ